MQKQYDLFAAKAAIDTDKLALRGKSLVSLADLDSRQLQGVLKVAAAMELSPATVTAAYSSARRVAPGDF